VLKFKRAPDDGRKGRPKYVEFWHQIKSKKSCISLVFIWSVYIWRLTTTIRVVPHS